MYLRNFQEARFLGNYLIVIHESFTSSSRSPEFKENTRRLRVKDTPKPKSSTWKNISNVTRLFIMTIIDTVQGLRIRKLSSNKKNLCKSVRILYACWNSNWHVFDSNFSCLTRTTLFFRYSSKLEVLIQTVSWALFSSLFKDNARILIKNESWKLRHSKHRKKHSAFPKEKTQARYR